MRIGVSAMADGIACAIAMPSATEAANASLPNSLMPSPPFVARV